MTETARDPAVRDVGPPRDAPLPDLSRTPWPGRLDLPAKFGFCCYGVRFDAAVTQTAGGGSKLTVEGDLGVRPYSAESATARRYIDAVLRAGEDLPHARIVLTDTQRIKVLGTMDFPDAPPRAAVAASASAIVVAVKPIIDMISMFREAGRAAG